MKIIGSASRSEGRDRLEVEGRRRRSAWRSAGGVSIRAARGRTRPGHAGPGLHNALVVPAEDARSRYRRARGACATRTFAAVALPDEAPQQVRAVVAVGGLVEGLLREGVGAMGRGRGLRHGGRTGRAGRARYSCRGAQGRAALSERLSRPTIAARLPPAPQPRRARAPAPRRAAPRMHAARRGELLSPNVGPRTGD